MGRVSWYIAQRNGEQHMHQAARSTTLYLTINYKGSRMPELYVLPDR